MVHSDNLDGTFTNPLIFADYPDPDIIRVDGDFYMVSSSFTSMPGIPICHSRDLVNWKTIGHAYQTLAMNPAYAMQGGRVMYRGGSWAPSIRHHHGQFYICFTTPAEGSFMCISARPEGPYTMSAFGTELYDPALFFDDDDRVYVAHGANTIYLTELTADARSIRTPRRILYETAYGTPLEGAHMYKRGGYYYICNTCRAYNGLEICYRSRNILGPYESRVISADDLNYAGAGLHQGGFVELADGQTWFFMFQDRDFIGRVPVLLPVTWVDDWPMVGEPQNHWRPRPTNSKPILLPHSAPSMPEGSDDFEEPALGLQWQWNHCPHDPDWSLTERPGFLRLRPRYAPDFLHARNTLGQKIVGPASTATTCLEINALRDGDFAGLAILGQPWALLGVHQEDGLRELRMLNHGELVETAGPITTPRVFLRVEATREGLARFFYSLDGSAYLPLGNDLAMVFTVKTFLGNQFALFAYRTVETGFCGHADFDYLQLPPATPANHRSAFQHIHAADYDDERGLDTERPTEKRPRQFLVRISDGDWARYANIDFGAGARRFEISVTTPFPTGGRLELCVDSLDSAPIGALDIPATGVWHAWQEHGCPIAPTSGRHALYLRFSGGEGELFRVDWFRFHQS